MTIGEEAKTIKSLAKAHSLAARLSKPKIDMIGDGKRVLRVSDEQLCTAPNNAYIVASGPLVLAALINWTLNPVRHNAHLLTP